MNAYVERTASGFVVSFEGSDGGVVGAKFFATRPAAETYLGRIGYKVNNRLKRRPKCEGAYTRETVGASKADT